MDQAIQDKSREALIQKYCEKAFESLAQYSYWGSRYEAADKQLEEMDANIVGMQQAITEMEAIRNKSSRDKVKVMREDLERSRKTMENLMTVAKELNKKAISWQQQGLDFIAMVDVLKEFKLKTPEEITKDRLAHQQMTEHQAKLDEIDQTAQQK